MEVLLRFVLLFLATTAVLVTADDSTNHYLGCLHESQCEKLFGGAYCCPTGTCCHFFVRDSSKFMSHCKRIRPAETTYCQDEDKVILSEKDLQNRHFLYEYPPNKGIICVRRKQTQTVFCTGGTDSQEEEFKAKGNHMTRIDAIDTNVDYRPDIGRSDVDRSKAKQYLHFLTRKAMNAGWIYEGKRVFPEV